MNNLILTQGMFEASKVLAPAIVRGRASLFFDGYGTRKWLTIRGSMNAGKSPRIKITLEIEFKKTVHQFALGDYLNLEWNEIRELLSDLDDEPVWITLAERERVRV